MLHNSHLQFENVVNLNQKMVRKSRGVYIDENYVRGKNLDTEPDAPESKKALERN